MRKFLAGTAFGLCALTVPALAADMSYPVKAPVVAPEIFSWTGPYVGLHAGYAWGRENDNQCSVLEEDGYGTRRSRSMCEEYNVVPADRFDVDGFVGGLHAGYNWQTGNLVLGIEGDIDYADVTGGTDFSYFRDYYTGHLSFESDWQASIRLRAGYAIDKLLIYATGGLAIGHGELRSKGYDDWCIGSCGSFDRSDSNTHVGWTLGGGFEYAFTSNWIGRIEGRYSDFGSEDYNLGEEGTISSSWTQTTVTAGISYKF